jgi:hypothetical protein
MTRLVAAIGVAVTVGCGLLLDVRSQGHAAPDNCPPACDRIPDSAWVEPTAIPLYSTYTWPRLPALAVTAADHRFRVEEMCAIPPTRADPRKYAVAGQAAVTNPPGHWQLQVQVMHWRGEPWRGGQLADAAVASAASALRACQLTAPQVSPSLTVDEPGRLAAVISVAGAAPMVAHEYLVSHPASGTLVELAMWASPPPLVAWPAISDDHLLDALTAPLCAAYIASCG